MCVIVRYNTACPGSAAEPPEYVFEASYEEGLNQRATDGSAVMSRLTVSLFYDGEPREAVGTWPAASAVNSYTACTNRMFKNEDAVMKAALPGGEASGRLSPAPGTPVQGTLSRMKGAPSPRTGWGGDERLFSPVALSAATTGSAVYPMTGLIAMSLTV